MKATCKNSANLEQETKTTKIVTYPLLSLASSIVDWFILFICQSIGGLSIGLALGIQCSYQIALLP